METTECSFTDNIYRTGTNFKNFSMDDSDKWASQIINALFEDKEIDATQKDLAIKDPIGVSVNKETEMSVLPTHLDSSRRGQMEVSNAIDFLTKSEENQLFSSHGKVLQPLKCSWGVSVALSDETSFAKNDESYSNLNSSENSCNFMEEMPGFHSDVSKLTADQTDSEEGGKEQMDINEHAAEEYMKNSDISVMCKIGLENQPGTIHSATSNSSYFSNKLNKINLNKSIESVYDEDSSKKENKPFLSHSLSYISNSDSSLNSLKRIDAKMKLLGLDGITKKGISDHRNKELSVYQNNMYKNIFRENCIRENIPFLSEHDDGTFEKSQVKDILAINNDISDHRQGFDTSQYKTENDFINLENDSNIDNSGENINSKIVCQETTFHNLDINEHETNTEKNVENVFEIEPTEDTKSSLLVLRTDALDSETETTESELMKSLEEIAHIEIPCNSFQGPYRRPSFNNDDSIITQRYIKIVETYRKACTTFEVLCVRPFAFFLAESIDFLMFVLFVLVYLTYVFYEQRNRLIVRKCLKSVKSHYYSLKREGQKFLLHFSSSNYIMLKKIGITLDKCSLIKSLQNKVTAYDETKIYLSIQPSDVCSSEFNVDRITRGLEGLCETGEKYLISLRKEQHSADLQICEDALVDIIQRINYVDKMYDCDDNDFDMEVIASSNVAKELKGKNDYKYSILEESKANVESTIPGSEVIILHSTRVDQVDSAAVAKHELKQSSHLEHYRHFLKSDLNIPCAISEHSASYIHNSESLNENRLNNMSMVVNMSESSTELEKIISLDLPSLTNDSESDVSEYICRNLKDKHDFSKKVNDSEKLSKYLCSPIDPSHSKSKKKKHGKKKLKFSASKLPVLDDNLRLERLENTSVTQNATDQFSLTPLPDGYLQHTILTTSSSNEFENQTRDNFTVGMDLYSNESKDKNKGKIRRRMSTIFTNWKSINMMPCMKAVPKNKKFKNSSDSNNL